MICLVEEKKAKPSSRIVPRDYPHALTRKIITLKPITAKSSTVLAPDDQTAMHVPDNLPDGGSTMVTIERNIDQQKHDTESLPSQEVDQTVVAQGHEEVAEIACYQIEPQLELAETASSMSYGVSHIDSNKLVLTYPAAHMQIQKEKECCAAETVACNAPIFELSGDGVINHTTNDSSNDPEIQTPSNAIGIDAISNMASSGQAIINAQSSQSILDCNFSGDATGFLASSDVPENKLVLPGGEMETLETNAVLQHGNVIYLLTKDS